MSEKEMLHQKEIEDYLFGTTVFLWGGSFVAMAGIINASPLILFIGGLMIGSSIPLIRLEFLLKNTNRFKFVIRERKEMKRWYRPF
ncbi:MAG TPA: hypothetical protein VMV95_03675 [Bacillota bacterium]|nr:hypothetical protein [Bacillota bacterium]